MKTLKLIPYKIIERSFNLSVSCIEQFYDMVPYKTYVDDLDKMKDGSLGKDIAQCLKSNKLNLVPGFESHDLKHVLLDFKMTPLDEIRMQAFMLGNGNYSLPCFIILLFGALLLPTKWKLFYSDFLKGRDTLPISSFTVDEYGHRNTNELRNFIFGQYVYRESIMKTLTKYGAIASICAGVAGMCVCLPFLFSSVTADLIGAGFPFIGGAILVSGGLLTLSNLSKQSDRKNPIPVV